MKQIEGFYLSIDKFTVKLTNKNIFLLFVRTTTTANIMGGQSDQEGSDGENEEGLGSKTPSREESLCTSDMTNESKYHLLQSVFQGKVYDRRSPGRRIS